MKVTLITEDRTYTLFPCRVKVTLITGDRTYNLCPCKVKVNVNHRR